MKKKLYHLSPHKFSRFTQREQSGGKATDLGFHFGTRDTAVVVADKLMHQGRIESGDPLYLYEVQLDIASPATLSENRLGSWSASSIIMTFFNDDNPHESVTDEQLHQYWEDEIWLTTGENLQDEPEWAYNDLVTQWIGEQGFDSIKYDNAFEGGGESYIVFNPDRIKILSVDEVEAP